MKTFYTLVLLTVLSTVHGQNIVAAEYFMDADPGLGSGTPMAITSGASIDQDVQLSTSSLSGGIHWLYIRVQDSNGTWSLHDRTMMYVGAAQVTAPLVYGEYFWDNDPGEGNATAIAFTVGDSMDVSLTVPTVGLAEGTHYLHVRVRDQSGNWGLYDLQEIEIINDIGIHEIAGLNAFTLYPSPTNDVAWLDLELTRSLQASISVVDMTGREVLQVEPGAFWVGLNRIRLDCSSLRAGHYQCLIRTTNGIASTDIVKM